jgi:multiple sugar transport system permease protein
MVASKMDSLARARVDLTRTGAPGSGLDPGAAPLPPTRGGRVSRSRRQGTLLVAPALAMVAIVTLLPIAFSVFMSFTDPAAGPDGFTFDWVGTANYQSVLGSEVFRHAVEFTVLFTVVTVVLEMSLGIAVAIVIDRMTVGRSFAIASMLVPWAVITVISAQLWNYIFNGVYGVANAILMWFHIIDEPTSFLSTPNSALVAMAIADIWKTTPFVAIVALGGLQMIDRELYQAAAIDGAGPIARFRAITLPMLRPALVTALTFRVLQSFGLFDLPFILTHGGPGHTTETVGVLAYDVLFGDLNFGAGAAISSLTTVMVLVAALVFFKIFGFAKEVADHD